MKHIQIAPSILSADFSAMGQAVETLQQAGADLIHCDVMDGSFVPNITFGHHMVRDIRKHTSLPLDVHLMIERPEKHAENFIKAGADIVTVHHEACGASLKDVLRLIRSLGAKCGAVINPDTPLSAVYGRARRGGYAARHERISWLRRTEIHSARAGKNTGGARDLRSLQSRCRRGDRRRREFAELRRDRRGGVNILVAGNTVFCSDDMEGTIAALKRGK